MTSKYRRTLSLEDLVNADDEIEGLLSPEESNNTVTEDSRSNHYHHLSSNSSNGIRGGPIIALGRDSPENDDFFIHGPQVPILNLDSENSVVEIEGESSSIPKLPRSKSVRFQEPEVDDRIGRVRGQQVGEVTDRMKDNVARLLEREASLGSLQDLSDQLQYSSDIYRQSSEHMRRKMFWRQQRGRMVIGAVIIFGIFLLVIPVITKLLQ